MTINKGDKSIVLKGDASLTKSNISLKRLVKYWGPADQGFLVECRAMEGGVSLAEWYNIDEVYTI